MMRKTRRQLWMRFAEAAGLATVALDLIVFLAVYRPLGMRLLAEYGVYRDLRQQVRSLEARVEALDKFRMELPEAAKHLDQFTLERTPSRRQGFSTAARLIQEAAEASAARTASVGYRLDKGHGEPFERLALEVSAQGGYAGMQKFVHALETSDELILVREFVIAPLDEGTVDARIKADLYLTSGP